MAEGKCGLLCSFSRPTRKLWFFPKLCMSHRLWIGCFGTVGETPSWCNISNHPIPYSCIYIYIYIYISCIFTYIWPLIFRFRFRIYIYIYIYIVYIYYIFTIRWWRWWCIVFVVWLTDEKRLALFPAGTIVRNPHHRKSLT